MYWVVTKKLFFSLILCKLFSFIMLLTWSAVVYHNSFLRENLEVEHLRRMWRLLSATWLLLWLKTKTENHDLDCLRKHKQWVNIFSSQTWNTGKLKLWMTMFNYSNIGGQSMCVWKDACWFNNWLWFIWVKRFVLIFVHVQ